MTRKFPIYLIILFVLNLLFSDCSKTEIDPSDLSDPSPCRFSMAHTMRIKCIVASPQNNAIAQPVPVNLTWYFAGANPLITVYYGTNKDSLKSISGITVNNYTLENLKLNTTYYWKFSAIENIECGLGCGSGILSFTTVPDINLPYVVTTDIPVHINTSALIGGNVMYEGSSTVTERGVYLSKSPSPEVTGSKITLGNGPGLFSVLHKNLDPENDYYIKSFATNTSGTAYGKEIRFRAGINAVFSKISDFEGNVYNTLVIGNQTWMVENLRSRKFSDGIPIEQVTDNSAWQGLKKPGWCWNNNDSVTGKNLYGALYNWYAVGTGKLCPAGWHVPNDSEWIILEMYLGMSEAEAGKYNARGTDEGTQMKSTSDWFENGNGTNTSDFSVLPGGIRWPAGFFNSSAGKSAYFWSTKEFSAYGDLIPSMAYFRSFGYNTSTIIRSMDQKINGMSVRCLKD